MFTEEDLEAEALLVKGGEEEPVIMNRLQAQLYALASDPATFLSDPDPADQAEYEKWKCDLDKRQGEISDLMVSNANVRKNYSSLVPDQVNHNLFWTRYFFKVHLIELQENKRQQLKARAEASTNDDEINWDDVADIAENSNIPENVQDKLLNDYEKELKEAKSKGKAEKEETSSDDWEKLSSGEKSPRKQSKEEVNSKKNPSIILKFWIPQFILAGWRMGSTIENKNNSTSQSKAVILEIGQEYEKNRILPPFGWIPLFLYYTFSLRLFFLTQRFGRDSK